MPTNGQSLDEPVRVNEVTEYELYQAQIDRIKAKDEAVAKAKYEEPLLVKVAFLRQAIAFMLSAAGLPDKDQALRMVIEWGKAALEENDLGD